MPSTSTDDVVGSGNWWPIHRSEIVGIARWIVLAWAAQTIVLALVGVWIVVEIRRQTAQEREDSDSVTRAIWARK